MTSPSTTFTNMKSGLNVNSIALAGEFFVLGQLALRGFDANMTLGHTKSVDILVSHPVTGKLCRLEVKTTSKPSSRSKLFGLNYQWVLGMKHETINDPDLYYAFVLLNEGDLRYFIVPSKEVAKYVKVQHQHWLKQNVENQDGDMRTFRIGLEKESHGLNLEKW